MGEKKFTYFYFIHVEYQHKLDQPMIEDIEDQYGRVVGTKTREFETSASFNAGTVVSDKPLTKFELFLKVRTIVLSNTNGARAKEGHLLFDVMDMIVTAFDGSRNEL